MNVYVRFRFVVLAFFAALILGCGGTPTRESTGEYFDDAAITAKVKTALLADKQVSGLAVNVETFKGTVQLSGFASTEAERERAAQVASGVKGVKSVKNDVRLK